MKQEKNEIQNKLAGSLMKPQHNLRRREREETAPASAEEGRHHYSFYQTLRRESEGLGFSLGYHLSWQTHNVSCFRTKTRKSTDLLQESYIQATTMENNMNVPQEV